MGRAAAKRVAPKALPCVIGVGPNTSREKLGSPLTYIAPPNKDNLSPI